MSHFNQSNMERKICVWITKYEILSEMCIVQHVQSVFTFQTMKRLVSTTGKKTCCHILNIPFREQKPTIMLFGGFIALQERRVATTRSHFLFW